AQASPPCANTLRLPQEVTARLVLLHAVVFFHAVFHHAVMLHAVLLHHAVVFLHRVLGHRFLLHTVVLAHLVLSEDGRRERKAERDERGGQAEADTGRGGHGVSFGLVFRKRRLPLPQRRCRDRV